MLKIRLSRTGKKHAPSFRIVVIPGESPRDGRALEVLGHFNPSTNPPDFKLDKERLQYWIKRGAQMTKAVEELAKGKYQFKPYYPKEKEEKEGEEKEADKKEPKEKEE
jgi:small subunit ribosomal protein S16